MSPTTIRIRKFYLSKEQLAKLSNVERDLFFLSGHILNELNSLNKVFSWCLGSTDEGSTETSRLAQGVQSMIYARILAGKLLEAWNALRSAWFSSKPSQALVDALHQDSRNALDALKKYFGRSNLIFNVRNTFAFHYRAGKLSEYWEEVSHGDRLQIVLGGTIGNNLDLAAELMVNAGVLKAASPANPEEGMRIFLDEIQTTASQFTMFLEGVTLVMLQKTLGMRFFDQAVEENVTVHASFSEIRIPYFCKPDEPKGA